MTGSRGNQSILKRLQQSDPLLCSWLNLPGGFQAGAYASAGLGAVLIDMQHGMIGYRDMVEMVQAADAVGSFAVVRPPLDDFSMVSRALDVGATGIVFPMINTAEDAEFLVEVAKFPPVGRRSWGPYLGMAQSGLSKEEYLANSNKLNAVFAMVETAEAMENLDEICAVEGLDGIFVGPNDLSISLTSGEVGDVNHPVVQEALPKILKATKTSDKFAGIFTGSVSEVKRYGQMGFCFMPALTDVGFIAQGVAEIEGELGA